MSKKIRVGGSGSSKSGAPTPPINIKRHNTLYRKAKRVLQSSGYKFFMKWANDEFRLACPSKFKDLQAHAEREGKVKMNEPV